MKRVLWKIDFRLLVLIFSLVALSLGIVAAQSDAQNVVLYASQATVKVGNWQVVSDSTAAGGARIWNPNQGAAKRTTALASPTDYFEMSFNAQSGTAYRLWMRGKAESNSPYNDSVFVQFSGSVNSSGTSVYRIGTTAAAEYNLEDCSGCSVQNWGWQDNGWGVGVMGPLIYFQTTGTQTLRIQVREDGLSIDQIVLSPSTYLNSSPGLLMNDTTIVPIAAPPPPPPPPPPPSGASTVVIWALNVPSSSLVGDWYKDYDSTAAGQTTIRNPERGAATIPAPVASPKNYFDISFNAVAGTPYHLWLRGKAQSNSMSNDSVYVQFSGSVDSNQAAIYRIGTTNGATMHLEDATGNPLNGWGWTDNAYGASVLGEPVYFQTTGQQTIRVQVREDGMCVDQIVLSPSTYLNSAPGASRNDNTIVPTDGGSPPPPSNQPPQVTITATPTTGTAPLAVSFTSSASDPDGYIASYSWTFGDGNTSTQPFPTNIYSGAGSYTARLTVTDNLGATASVTKTITASSPAPPPPSSSQLKVLSYNSSFAKGTDNIYNPDRTATSIANINPDLIALCEVPSTIAVTLRDLVAQKTGRTWYYYHVVKYSGTTEGNLILSKYPILSSSFRYLSYQRSVAQVTVSVGGRNINFFATHLDPDSSGGRATEVAELKSFASGFAEPRIICGDFNAGPDTSEMSSMSSGYYDSWMQALNMSAATAYPDNPLGMHTRTRRGRIDYIWYSNGTTILSLRNAQIPDSRDLNNRNVVVYLGTLDDLGVRPSDHNQMVATFDVR